MVDLGAHCFPPATILNGGGATWGLVSPFLVILGFLQFYLRCHCMGLIWSRPRWTCFSVAVNNPMMDISCWAGQVSPVNRSLIFVLSVCHQSRVGLTLPSFRSNW